MNAIVYHSYGGPEVLELVELPDPMVHADSVLVRIQAAAVNPADLKMRAGAAGSVPSYFPVIPGWDIAGVVEQAGLGAPEFSAGDEVIGYIRSDVEHAHGGYAELVAADVRTLAAKPNTLSWEQAAALPLAGLTAYRAIVHALHISDTDILLIHGAAGGVGSLAAQIALARGATVVGSAAKTDAEYLTSLGARPVHYEHDLAEQIRSLAPGGVDAVFDTVGRGSLASTAASGHGETRLASIVQFDYPGTIPVFARLDPADLRVVSRLADSGRLTPRIGATFDLADAAEAHRLAETGSAAGRIILTRPLLSDRDMPLETDLTTAGSAVPRLAGSPSSPEPVRSPTATTTR
jgi:NADPH:quinone reductase-like Zn-dependent oxidoreductase